MVQWLLDNWLAVAIPVLAFLATYVVGLWLKRALDDALERWSVRTKWPGSRLVVQAVRRHFLQWFLLLGAAIAIGISVFSPEVKAFSTRVIGSLFVFSLGWTVIGLSEQLLRLYMPRMKFLQPTIVVAVSIVRISFIVLGTLIVLDIWGIPTTPILLFIAVLVLVAALALRNVAPDFFAGLQLSATQQIKAGDYIKLETGEEGYVTELSWSNTRIRALAGTVVVVPSSRLLNRTVINYGRPLKKAKEPFRFYSRVYITELTGLRARNLREFVAILKTVPDSVVYHHTHSFLEQQHYLTPEPSNDFAAWVNDALGDEVLAERLASVDTFEFTSLGALRDRLVSVAEEYLAAQTVLREAMPGGEFYFMKSVSAVLQTPYVASDLREFVETLRKISVGSLYFHIFESRLRLGRGLNDFSFWIRDSLDEPELSADIGRLDPYTYTLEGLRLALIQLIEKRIK